MIESYSEFYMKAQSMQGMKVNILHRAFSLLNHGFSVFIIIKIILPVYDVMKTYWKFNTLMNFNRT